MTSEASSMGAVRGTPVPPTEFGTVAGAAVIAECLRTQADARPRSWLARLLGRSPLSDASRSWYLGALGELEVARRLASLGDGWTVVHSVPVGTQGSDIDHVVVGAAGAFTINTKHHEGARVGVGRRRLFVNGQPTDHLRNARYEARRTAKLLTAATGTPVPVAAVVVIVGARQVSVREQQEDVTVLEASDLLRWLKLRKPRVDAGQLSTLNDVVRARETWTREVAATTDSAAFAALQREVVTAKRVRMLWSAAVALGIIGVAGPAATGLYSGLLG
ncbi:nuclease-related domain-containing protein [Microbacterium oleivorans]|uniref:nuclease-related domain-containing protein n=1 Tax=Microbacterium oleivorans TaxID=273677 RepID=UPI00203BD581|nr:nuclease-related domain-containing protein [Microbacterium oleivorans]MCM3695951.1 NERD domain-containing protein [Microbacterium oleivorans]